MGPDNLGRKHTSEEFATIFTREATSVDRNLVPQYFNQLKNEATLIAAPIEKAGKYFNVWSISLRNPLFVLKFD